MDRNASGSRLACCRWRTMCMAPTLTANQRLRHLGCRWDAVWRRRVLENYKTDAANWRLSVFICSSLRFGTHAYAPLVCRCDWNRIDLGTNMKWVKVRCWSDRICVFPPSFLLRRVVSCNVTSTIYRCWIIVIDSIDLRMCQLLSKRILEIGLTICFLQRGYRCSINSKKKEESNSLWGYCKWL